jgi:hypothetical protein
VSYDIYFVRRDPGQSFEDALDAIEESFEGDPGPLAEADLEAWEAILPLARRILGDVAVFEDETTRELSDGTTGIELSLFNGEVALRVPFGDVGEGSVEVMGKVYELSRAIERATGLEGYDPQLEEPVTDERATGAAPRRAVSSWDDEDDDATAPDGTSASPPAPRPARVAAATDSSPPRWWEFWKS